MIRILYPLLVRVLAPLVLLNFLWRGLRERGYWRDLPERLGFGERLDGPVIWVHAVSVGEVQAATPLLRSLGECYPQHRLLLTTTTPTGRARGRANLGDRLLLRYLPYDLPGAVARFFDRARPQIAIIIEKEVWPNLYRECGLRKVPLVLASAALPARSVNRWRSLATLFPDTLRHGLVIAAQSADDAARFIAIGVPPERTHVVGNIKFDGQLSADAVTAGRAWRSHYAARERFTIVAGSTYEFEERALLQALAVLRAAGIDPLLVLAPRHPPRFEAVARMLLETEAVVMRHSQAKHGASLENRAGGDLPEVVLLDTRGELAACYAAADVAFVGGSLLAGIGGHNALEPAALGVPVLMGPHVANIKEIVAVLAAAEGLQQVTSPAELAAALMTLAQDPKLREQRGRAAQAVVARNRGALARLMSVLDPLIAARPPSR